MPVVKIWTSGEKLLSKELIAMQMMSPVGKDYSLNYLVI